jgi:hypothetical protein
MEEATGMPCLENFDEIREQQRDAWDSFSIGWKKWDELVFGWVAPFGDAMLRLSNLREDSYVFDVAGTGGSGTFSPSGNSRKRRIYTLLEAARPCNGRLVSQIGGFAVRFGNGALEIIDRRCVDHFVAFEFLRHFPTGIDALHVW